MPNCFKLLTHEIRLAASLALLNAGKSIPARMAMIAITTKSSISVNAERFTCACCLKSECKFIIRSFGYPRPSAGYRFVGLGALAGNSSKISPPACLVQAKDDPNWKWDEAGSKLSFLNSQTRE